MCSKLISRSLEQESSGTPWLAIVTTQEFIPTVLLGLEAGYTDPLKQRISTISQHSARTGFMFSYDL